MDQLMVMRWFWIIIQSNVLNLSTIIHSNLGQLSTTANPSTTQQPQQRVLNCQNSLSTTASFFQPLTKTSGMVLKFDPHGALMINRGNRISIVFHIFCCSMHKLSTIPLANVASLARFFMLAIWFKKLFKFFSSVFHLFISFTLGLPLWDTASMNMSYSPNKLFRKWSPGWTFLSYEPISLPDGRIRRFSNTLIE